MATSIIRHEVKLTIKSNTETKAIATGLSSVSVDPPSGYTKWGNAWLVAGYPRTDNIFHQGCNSDGSAIRLINQKGSAWTGEFVSFWLCFD